MGHAASLRVPRPLREPLYGAFVAVTGARGEEAERPLSEYDTFNALFTRKLRDGARPWSDASWSMPADGRLADVQRVRDGVLIQAKGIEYTLAALLGDEERAGELSGALAATIYLSPADYHRVHVPANVTFDRILHVGGELWPVNATSVARVDGLFARNERAVACFTSADGRRGAMVMVAATVVGGIELACDDVDLSTRHRGDERAHWDVTWQAEAGEWFGTFHLGSTVVLVVEGDTLRSACEPGGAVRVGQPLFVDT